MTLTESIKLLENASARNFSSKDNLLDACDKMAGHILKMLPEGMYELPRGYKQSSGQWIPRYGIFPA